MSASNNSSVLLSLLHQNELDELSAYLLQLSPETKKRFSPHPFDKLALTEFYHAAEKYTGYIAREIKTNRIIAYAVIRTGYFEHDKQRLESYGLMLNQGTDCNFAPAVADAWQGMGIGKKLLAFVITDLKNMGLKRIILWGGVQKDNESAVNYYLRNGFRILGQFSWNGENYDMALDLNRITDAVL